MFCTLNYRTFLIVRLVLHNKKGARMRRRFRVQTIYEVLWPIAYFIRTTVALNTRIRECHFTRKNVSRRNLILSILMNLLFCYSICYSYQLFVKSRVIICKISKIKLWEKIGLRDVCKIIVFIVYQTHDHITLSWAEFEFIVSSTTMHSVLQ